MNECNSCVPDASCSWGSIFSLRLALWQCNMVRSLRVACSSVGSATLGRVGAHDHPSARAIAAFSPFAAARRVLRARGEALRTPGSEPKYLLDFLGSCTTTPLIAHITNSSPGWHAQTLALQRLGVVDRTIVSLRVPRSSEPSRMIVFFKMDDSPILPPAPIHARFVNLPPHFSCISIMARISVYMRAEILRIRISSSCSCVPRT